MMIPKKGEAVLPHYKHTASQFYGWSCPTSEAIIPRLGDIIKSGAYPHFPPRSVCGGDVMGTGLDGLAARVKAGEPGAMLEHAP